VVLVMHWARGTDASTPLDFARRLPLDAEKKDVFVGSAVGITRASVAAAHLQIFLGRRHHILFPSLFASAPVNAVVHEVLAQFRLDWTVRADASLHIVLLDALALPTETVDAFVLLLRLLDVSRAGGALAEVPSCVDRLLQPAALPRRFPQDALEIAHFVTIRRFASASYLIVVGMMIAILLGSNVKLHEGVFRLPK